MKLQSPSVLKTCSKCGVEKPIDFFGLHWNKKHNKKLVNSRCKACQASATRDRNLANPLKKKESDAKYSRNNREKLNAYARKRYQNNPDSRKDYFKKYNKSENKAIACRRYLEKHPDRRALTTKKYQPRANEWQKKKKKEDPNFRIRCNLRTRLWQSLKINGAVKQCKFDEYTGCSLDQLRMHLESLFTTGMSWDNYGKGDGKWNIDHIIPCAKFDLTKKGDQLKCFHWSNLQPMWERDNIRKGTKIIAA